MRRLTPWALLAMLAGCTTTPHYDAHFGDAVRQARSAMTIDPDAASRPGPAPGMDGPAAQQAIGRYQDSFKAPPPPRSVNVISLGGVQAN